MENPSPVLAAHDWIALAPDAAFPTSRQRLPVFGRSAASSALALPKLLANIAPWIPSPLPRPAARSATPPAVATAPGCFRTSVAQIGIRRGLQRQPQLRPASFYARQFPLSYKPFLSPWREAEGIPRVAFTGSRGYGPPRQGEEPRSIYSTTTARHRPRRRQNSNAL